ncbi:hypothetical protein D1007_53542 [Hordeum vulgare]|nr:hypothetical protein D1007_53542 [Hordeum vulgare]
MQFTHSAPGIFPHAAVAGPALQIFSIKIVDLNANLGWPLHVYGVVAARDTVDRNRNLLFSQSRENCQQVTKADPFLLLTGPSRAIVAADTVKFEVELRIMYAGADPKDTVLFSSTYNYYSMQQYASPRIHSCCVQLEQTLKVVIQAYSESGLGYLHNVEDDFPVQQCQITKCLCTVGNSTAEIVVAWSLLAMDKLDLVLEGYVTPV